jgi:hypothetical protein
VSTPHLDDEQLSLLLDGEDLDGRARVHVDGCEACAGRLSAMTAARDAVRGAGVAPLTTDALDRFVVTALSATGDDGTRGEEPDIVVPFRARRRLPVPPPAWLVGAAAALAALVGIAGFLRAADTDSQASLSLTSGADDAGSGDSAGGASSNAATESAATAGAGALDTSASDVARYDLADQDDPAELVARLRERQAVPAASAFSAQRALEDEDRGTQEGAPSAGSAPPATTIAVDRAQCRSEAERLGAGRFASLESTGTLRWRGQAAEVLVFVLTPSAPDDGVTRQAMVLARPGCALLADPRF